MTDEKGRTVSVGSGDLLAALIAKCQAAEVPQVYASTQYGMGFLVANHGVNGGGIVFRDDKMPHAARETLAAQLNAALANLEMSHAHPNRPTVPGVGAGCENPRR